jgi:hypothetical protein
MPGGFFHRHPTLPRPEVTWSVDGNVPLPVKSNDNRLEDLYRPEFVDGVLIKTQFAQNHLCVLA